MKFVLIFSLLLLTQENEVKKKVINQNTQNKNKQTNFKNLEELMDITNYDYPKKSIIGEEYFVVPIIATSDIHGHIIPENFTDYLQAGASYFASYIEIMKNEWGADNIILVDSGDIFQGGYESKISEGEIMIKFFNSSGVKLTTFGNHEFDYGEDYIRDKVKKLRDVFVSSNVFEAGTGNEEEMPGLENVVKTKIIKVGNIDIGFIGVTTIETKTSSGADLSYLDISDQYKSIIEEKAEELRSNGAKAVIVLAHSGYTCENKEDSEILKLEIYDKNNTLASSCQAKGEIETITKQLIEGEVDVILGGHLHINNHYFINNIPVVTPADNLHYFNIVYLFFDKNTGEYKKDMVKMEGPIPVCSKIYSNYKRCGEFNEEEKKNLGDLKEFTFHGTKIVENIGMSNALKEYTDKVKNASNEILFTINGDNSTDYGRVRDKESFMGNLISDIYRETAGADFGIVNEGSFRSSWHPGPVSLKEFYDMFPYDNSITSAKISGDDIKTLIEGVQLQGDDDSKRFYCFSGATIEYNEKIHKIISFTFIDGSPLNTDKIYSIATNSYLIPGFGSVFANVKNNITINDPIFYKDEAYILKEWLKLKETINANDYYDIENKPRLIYSSRENYSNSTNSSSTRDYQINLEYSEYLRISSSIISLMILLLY